MDYLDTLVSHCPRWYELQWKGLWISWKLESFLVPRGLVAGALWVKHWQPFLMPYVPSLWIHSSTLLQNWPLFSTRNSHWLPLCLPQKSHKEEWSYLHCYSYKEPTTFIKSPPHILLYFLEAAYQNFTVVFLSCYPKNIIKNEAVNTTIWMHSVSNTMLFSAQPPGLRLGGNLQFIGDQTILMLSTHLYPGIWVRDLWREKQFVLWISSFVIESCWIWMYKDLCH